jgi:NAD(P)-dependent dehydrogenase (short-subunit alcohol dehydrogenase family)
MWTAADVPDQSGKTVIITGANAGLGLEAAKVLAARGARVVMACRSRSKAEAAMDAIRQETPGAALEFAALDLGSLRSVEACAVDLSGRFAAIDALINNAGLMATDPSLTEDGFETQFGVNHLGHFALTARLLPLLAKNPGARIVSHSSMGHRGARGSAFPNPRSLDGYDRWNVYFWSKLANLLFTAELQRRLAAAGHAAIATVAHPGASHTDLGSEGQHFTNRVTTLFMPWATQPASQGALPLLRAATDPEAQPGDYFGPRWMLRGLPVKETPSARARDAALACRLWDDSVRWTGLDPLGPE